MRQILQELFVKIYLLLMIAIAIDTRPRKINNSQVLINDTKVYISFASIPSVVKHEVTPFLALA